MDMAPKNPILNPIRPKTRLGPRPKHECVQAGMCHAMLGSCSGTFVIFVFIIIKLLNVKNNIINN